MLLRGSSKLFNSALFAGLLFGPAGVQPLPIPGGGVSGPRFAPVAPARSKRVIEDDDDILLLVSAILGSALKLDD